MAKRPFLHCHFLTLPTIKLLLILFFAGHFWYWNAKLWNDQFSQWCLWITNASRIIYWEHYHHSIWSSSTRSMGPSKKTPLHLVCDIKTCKITSSQTIWFSQQKISFINSNRFIMTVEKSSGLIISSSSHFIVSFSNFDFDFWLSNQVFWLNIFCSASQQFSATF